MIISNACTCGNNTYYETNKCETTYHIKKPKNFQYIKCTKCRKIWSINNENATKAINEGIQPTDTTSKR